MGALKGAEKNTFTLKHTHAPTDPPTYTHTHPRTNTTAHCTHHRGVETFETYYRQQRILEGEGEFETLMRALKKPLPISFRVCVVASRQGEVEEALKEARPFLQVGTMIG